MNIENFQEKQAIEDLLKLDKQAVEDFIHLFEGRYSQQDIYDIPHLIKDGKGEFFVGTEDGVVIAMGGYVKMDAYRAKLMRFRVEKSLQGKGLGSHLLKHVEKAIKLKGCQLICFDTASLRKKTLEFYKKHGYRITGQKKIGKLKIIEFGKNLFADPSPSA